MNVCVAMSKGKTMQGQIPRSSGKLAGELESVHKWVGGGGGGGVTQTKGNITVVYIHVAAILGSRLML